MATHESRHCERLPHQYDVLDDFPSAEEDVLIDKSSLIYVKSQSAQGDRWVVPS